MRVPLLVCLCLYLGVFFHSRVTGACPVATDLTMRVNNVRTTTTTTTTKTCWCSLSEKLLLYCIRHKTASSSTSKRTSSHKIHVHARTGTTGRTAVLHRRSNCPSVHSARTTHTPRSVGWEGELPTAYMPGSSAVVGGPTRRNTRRSLIFHSYCCIAEYWRTRYICQEGPYFLWYCHIIDCCGSHKILSRRSLLPCIIS